MEKQIEKLIELAKDYVVFGNEIQLPDTHNHVRSKDLDNEQFLEGELINIYLANKGTTWAVDFGKVKVSGYAKSISLPFNTTEEMLKELHDDAEKYLHEHLLPNVAKCKIGVLKNRHKEIKELERKLRMLKGLA